MKVSILSTVIGQVLKLMPEVPKTKSLASHNVILIDRSSSMCNEIDTVIEQVKAVLKSAPSKDIFTVAWFSGLGQNGITLKGACINATNLKMLDTLNSTVNTTCFSEVLASVLDAVKEYKDVVDRTTVSIFTDGQPVVNWSIQEEEKRCITALRSLVHNGVSVINAIGYAYYNERLMRAMVDVAPLGKVMHLPKIEKYGAVLGQSLDLMSNLTGEQLAVQSKAGVLFVNGDMTKLMFNLDVKNTVAGQPVYVLLEDGQQVVTINGETVKLSVIPQISDSDETFNYALASALYYNGDARVRDVLYASKDRYLIEKLDTAFSNNERAQLQQMLYDAITNPDMRLLTGKVDRVIENQNTPTFFDLLDVLVSTGADVNLPSYNTTTRGSVVVKNHFTPSKAGINFKITNDNVVYHKTRLNVSVRTKVQGSVQLTESDAKAFNSNKFDCAVFRTYTLIKDGEYNTDTLNVVVDDSAKFKEFTDKFAVLNVEAVDGKITFQVDLTEIPKINRKAVANNDVNFYFDNARASLELEARQKVLNALLKTSEVPEPIMEGVTPLQAEILAKYGVNSQGLYAPQSVAMDTENCDSYITKVIEFNIKGSSLPTLDKAKDGKSKAVGSVLMFNAYNDYKDLTVDDLQTERVSVVNQLKILRLELAKNKFAMLLTGGFINGLDKDGESLSYTKDGFTLNVKVEYKKEYISA